MFTSLLFSDPREDGMERSYSRLRNGVGVKSFWCSTTALKKTPSSHPCLWFDGKLNEFRKGEMQKGNWWGGKQEEALSRESGVVHAEAGSPVTTTGRGITSTRGRWVL